MINIIDDIAIIIKELLKLRPQYEKESGELLASFIYFLPLSTSLKKRMINNFLSVFMKKINDVYFVSFILD